MDAMKVTPALNMPAWDSRLTGALKLNGKAAEDDA